MCDIEIFIDTVDVCSLKWSCKIGTCFQLANKFHSCPHRQNALANLRTLQLFPFGFMA